MSIPKIIHQIWLGPNKRPDIWMNTWKVDYLKQYPDWTYKLWTESELDELDMVNKKIYKNEKYYNCKSDIARYEILYQQGGIFMDADSMWIKKTDNSLDKILDMVKEYGGFCAEEPINKWSLANGVIGFAKEHIVLKQNIEYIKNNYHRLKKKYKRQCDVWLVTGPGIFTKIVKENKDTIKILDSIHFYPESFHKNNLNLDSKNFHNLYPHSIAFQYGYSTNNYRDNCMKKFIDNS